MRCSRRLYYRLRIKYLEEDLLPKLRAWDSSKMLERCYERSERDLARLRMALERAAQLEERTEIFAGERPDELAKKKKPAKSSNGPHARSKKTRRSCSKLL